MKAVVLTQRAEEESSRAKPADDKAYLKALKAEAEFLDETAARIKRQTASMKRLRAKMDRAINASALVIAETDAFLRDRAE